MENFWRVNKAGIAQTGSYCGLTQSFHWKSVAMCKSCQDCGGDHMDEEDDDHGGDDDKTDVDDDDKRLT